jgi:hypothetical protein
MPRYFSAPVPPRSDDDGWHPDPLLPDLWVADHRPVDTGLVDARGHPIMRAPNPLGFGKDAEWS